MSELLDYLSELEKLDPLQKYSPDKPAPDPFAKVGTPEVMAPMYDPLEEVRPFAMQVSEDAPQKNYTLLQDVEKSLGTFTNSTLLPIWGAPLIPAAVAAEVAPGIKMAAEAVADTTGRLLTAPVESFFKVRDYGDKKVAEGLRQIPDLLGYHETVFSRMKNPSSTDLAGGIFPKDEKLPQDFSLDPMLKYPLMAASAVTPAVPLVKYLQSKGLFESEADLMEYLQTFGRGAAGVAIDMMNPTDVALSSVLKGIGKVSSWGLKTTTGRKAVDVFNEKVFGSLPKDVQEMFRLGAYHVPDKTKELLRRYFSDRLRDQNLESKILDDSLNLNTEEYRAFAETLLDTKLEGADALLYNKAAIDKAISKRAGQIHAGGSSTGEMEHGIKRRVKAVKGFIKVLQNSLLKANTSAKWASAVVNPADGSIKLGPGIMSDDMADTIHASLGQYLTRVYRFTEAPLKEGAIPNSVLATMWQLGDEERDAISALSPRASDLAVTNYMRASNAGRIPYSGGYKNIKISQNMFKSRMETDRAASLWDSFEDAKIKLQDKVGNYNLDKLGFGEGDTGFLNEAGITLEEIASHQTKGGHITGSGEALRAKISNVLGRRISTERARDLVQDAVNLIRERNQLKGKIGDLTYKQRNVRFYANAKFGVEDLAKHEGTPSQLASELSGILGRQVTPLEAQNMKVTAQGYVEGKIGEDALGEVANVSFDFEKYRAAIHEITDFNYRASKTMHDLSFNTRTAELYNYLAMDPKIVLPVGSPVTAGYVQVPKSRMYGALAGRHVQAGTYNEITDVMNFRKDFEKWGRQAVSNWKYIKTADPAVVFNNVIGNMIISHVGLDISPKRQLEHYAILFDDVLGKKGFYKDAIKNGKMEFTTLNESELRSFKQAILDKYENIPDMQRPGLLMRILNAGDILPTMSNAFGTMEQLGKLTAYRELVLRGIPKLEAGKIAENALFNYRDANQAIKWARSSPFGVSFITFPTKMAGLIAKNVFNNPMRLMQYPLMFNAMESGMAAMEGISPEQMEYQKGLAQKNSPAFSWLMWTNVKDQHGNRYFWDATRSMPWGNFSDIGSLFGSLTPGGLAKPVIEAMMNKNLLTGQPIYGDPTQVSGPVDWFHKSFGEGKELNMERQVEMGQQLMAHFIRSYGPALLPSVPGTKLTGGYSFARMQRAFEQDQRQKAGKDFQVTPEAVDRAAEMNPEVRDAFLYSMPRQQSFGQAVTNSLFGVTTFKQRLTETKLKKMSMLRNQINSKKAMIAQSILHKLDGTADAKDMDARNDMLMLEINMLMDKIKKLGIPERMPYEGPPIPIQKDPELTPPIPVDNSPDYTTVGEGGGSFQQRIWGVNQQGARDYGY